MIGRRTIAGLFAAALAAAVVAAAPTGASASTAAAGPASVTAVALAPAVSAYEWNTAASWSAPSLPDSDCITMTGAKACFEPHGDYLWVEDTKADGHSATATWNNYIYTGSSWELWRQGSCVNKLGAGTWGLCNKDFDEYSEDGSYIDLYACVYDSGDGTWHGCSSFREITNSA
jgi:hypothetical protein